MPARMQACWSAKIAQADGDRAPSAADRQTLLRLPAVCGATWVAPDMLDCLGNPGPMIRLGERAWRAGGQSTMSRPGASAMGRVHPVQSEFKPCVAGKPWRPLVQHLVQYLVQPPVQGLVRHPVRHPAPANTSQTTSIPSNRKTGRQPTVKRQTKKSKKSCCPAASNKQATIHQYDHPSFPTTPHRQAL